MQKVAIAARIRGLIAGQHNGDLGAVADKLGVDEMSLRLSIDELSPYPTMDVLAAVVQVYGVDPTWLVTGIYNASTHRNSEEGSPDSAGAAIRAMLEPRIPISEQPDAPTLRLIRDG